MHSATPSLAIILPLCLAAVAILGACLAILSRRRPELKMKKSNMQLGAKTTQTHHSNLISELTVFAFTPFY